jgi:hypothetical protein
VTPEDQADAFADDEPTHSPSAHQNKRREAAPKAQSPVNNNTNTNASSSIAYTAPDDRPIGPQYQATHIPAFRPLPAQPSASEARFLHLQPLYPTTADQQPAGETADASSVGAASRAAASAMFKAAYEATPPGPARAALLDAAVKVLDNQMGPELVKVSRHMKMHVLLPVQQQVLLCRRAVCQ